MPLPVAGVLAAAGPWIARFLAVKGVLIVVKMVTSLGLVLATNEYIMQPLLDALSNAIGSLPPAAVCWMQTFGVMKALSILFSALTLASVKTVFLSKRA